MSKSLYLVDGHYKVKAKEKVGENKYTYEIETKNKNNTFKKVKGDYIYRGKTKEGYNIYDKYSESKSKSPKIDEFYTHNKKSYRVDEVSGNSVYVYDKNNNLHEVPKENFGVTWKKK